MRLRAWPATNKGRPVKDLPSPAKRSRLSLYILALGGVLFSTPVFAGSAQLTMAPTRVVLEGSDRYATITIKNSGDAIGRYRIELVDASMQPNGGVKVLEKGERDPFGALEILSISPRTMTLKPDDFQTVRLLVKDTAAIKDGEYRSHLRVRMTENDLNEKTDKPNGDAAGIAIKPRLAMVIPIIVRRGKTHFKVDIADEKLLPPALENGPPQMQVTFGFTGNRSVIGDVRITHTDAAGGQNVLKFFPGVAIYRGTPSRDVIIPLDVPSGVDVHSGKIGITYLSQDKDNAQVLAEKSFTP
jgi:hypothetical protein